jgi:hypothetical protein
MPKSAPMQSKIVEIKLKTLTVRERLLLLKIQRVFQEFVFDCDSDIEGCDGDQLRDIEASLNAQQTLMIRIMNYISGDVDNPRGVKNGEEVFCQYYTPWGNEAKMQNCHGCGHYLCRKCVCRNQGFYGR